MNDTLLIVDVQEGMFSHPQTSMFRTEKAIERIRSLIAEARATNTPVVYIQHGVEKRRSSRIARALDPEIAPREGDLVIRSFYADSFEQLYLQREMEAACVRTLIVTGLDTERCLDTACSLTFDLGYDVTVVLDTADICNN